MSNGHDPERRKQNVDLHEVKEAIKEVKDTVNMMSTKLEQTGVNTEILRRHDASLGLLFGAKEAQTQEIAKITACVKVEVERLRAEIKSGDAKLHGRINIIRNTFSTIIGIASLLWAWIIAFFKGNPTGGH